MLVWGLSIIKVERRAPDEEAKGVGWTADVSPIVPGRPRTVDNLSKHRRRERTRRLDHGGACVRAAFKGVLNRVLNQLDDREKEVHPR